MYKKDTSAILRRVSNCSNKKYESKYVCICVENLCAGVYLAVKAAYKFLFS